jgi:hypothetical protein
MFRTLLYSIGATIFSVLVSGAFVASPVVAQTDFPVFDRASVKGELASRAIHVFSGDENTYTAIRENSLTYNVQVRLGLSRGRLRRYTISPGGIMDQPGAEDITFRARGLSEVRERHALSVPLTATNNVRNYLVAQCNNLLAKGANEERRHEITADLPVKLTAVAGRRGEDGDRNRRIIEVMGSATANIVCEPVFRSRPAVVSEMFLDTPEITGKFCPQDVSMKAWIFSDRPGEFAFRVVGDDGSASSYYKVRTERHYDGKVYAQARHAFSTDRPFNGRFRLEVRGQQAKSGWVRVDVPCLRKPRPTAAFAIEAARLKIEQPQHNRCPQKVTLNSRIRTNGPGPVKFRIEQGNGRMTPTFTANSVQRQNGRFVAFHAHKIRFPRTRASRYRTVVNGSRAKSDWVRVDVSCAKQPQAAAFAVEDSTIKITQTASNQCPQNITLTTRIRTNRPGPVKFRIEEGSGRTSQAFTINSIKRQNGRFIAVHEHKDRFNRSRKEKYRVIVNGFPGASQWRWADVKCHAGAAAPGPFKVKKSALAFRVEPGNRCPRPAAMNGWFITNKPGKVQFRIAWANGRQSDVIKVNSRKEKDGRFVARFKKPMNFPLPVNWRIRSVVEGQKLASNWTAVRVACGKQKREPKWQKWQDLLLRKLEEGTINSPN